MKRIIPFVITLIAFCNVHSQWITLNSPASADLNSVCFVNSSTGFIAGDNGTIFKTTNGGISWVVLASGISSTINSISFINSLTGIACANSGIIIRTTNSGLNWIAISSGVTEDLRAVSFNTDKGICSGNSGTILYSGNGGLSWNTAVTGFLVTYFGAYMYSQSAGYACGVNTIFAPFLAKTTNGGVNWNYSSFYINSSEGDLKDIHFISENEGFAVSFAFIGGGVSHTTNGGANWTSQVFPNLISCIDFPVMNTGYAAGQNGFIIKTTDRGINWISQNSTTNNHLNNIDFSDSVNGYAVGNGGIILKTTNGGITEISISEPGNVYGYSLNQNYPNPFNPVTKISYELQVSSYASLKVYDMLGKEVAVLVNQKQNAGSYEVEFDGSGYPGGVYFYKLSAESFSDTKRMMIIK